MIENTKTKHSWTSDFPTLTSWIGLYVISRQFIPKNRIRNNPENSHPYDIKKATTDKPGHLAQSGASLTTNQGVTGSSPSPATLFRSDLVMKTISMTILTLLLIQEE